MPTNAFCQRWRNSKSKNAATDSHRGVLQNHQAKFNVRVRFGFDPDYWTCLMIVVTTVTIAKIAMTETNVKPETKAAQTVQRSRTAARKYSDADHHSAAAFPSARNYSPLVNRSGVGPS